MRSRSVAAMGAALYQRLLAASHRGGAWGVHLGQEDMETADLAAIQAAGCAGISTHGYFELMRARELAPPISHWAISSRPTPRRCLRAPRAGAAAPLPRPDGGWPTVAIGGISEERVAAVKVSGVGSIALVSAITASDDWQGRPSGCSLPWGRG